MGLNPNDTKLSRQSMILLSNPAIESDVKTKLAQSPTLDDRFDVQPVLSD